MRLYEHQDQRIELQDTSKYRIKYLLEDYDDDLLKDNIYKNIPETNDNFFSLYREPKFSYTPIPEANNLCLIGYFQSKLDIYWN